MKAHSVMLRDSEKALFSDYSGTFQTSAYLLHEPARQDELRELSKLCDAIDFRGKLLSEKTIDRIWTALLELESRAIHVPTHNWRHWGDGSVGEEAARSACLAKIHKIQWLLEEAARILDVTHITIPVCCRQES